MKITDSSFKADIEKGIPFEALNTALRDKYNLHPVYAYTDIYERICRDDGILGNIEYMLESYSEVDNKPFLLAKFNTNPHVHRILFHPKVIIHGKMNIFKQTLYVKPEVYSFMLMGGLLKMKNKCHTHETIIEGNL